MNLAELKALAKAAEHYARITSSRSEVVDFYSCIIPDGIVELIANYEKAVEALKFYSDSDNYGHVSAESLKYIVLNENDMGKGEFQLSERVDDDGVGGKLARQTLKELGEVE